MQIAQELAGYSLGGADLLRRAMGKKIKSEMEAQRTHFIEGAMARGVPDAKAALIFEQVAKFAGYGFNKSHAAAYALVAYQTAYLTANYPVEFLAASMTYDTGNTDKLNIFRQELARLDIPLLPPDVNRSCADFRVEIAEDGRRVIRYALAAVKNVGGAAMTALVAERDGNGPYRSLADFAQRLDVRQVNKRQIESLARGGAFDALTSNRRQVFEGAERIVRLASAATSERESQQSNLFGDAAEAPAAALTLPEVEDWPAMDRLRHEFEAIGFYLTAHPLEAYGRGLDRLGTVQSGGLAQAVEREPGRKKMAGIVIAKQERTSRQGNRFAFVQLSDTSGVFEVTIFAELLSRSRELLESGQPLLLGVEVRQDGGELRLNAQDIQLLDEVVARSAAGLKLYLRDAAGLQSLQSLLTREEEGPASAAAGRARINLILESADGAEVEMELPGQYRLSGSMRQAIKSIPGVTVEDL